LVRDRILLNFRRQVRRHDRPPLRGGSSRGDGGNISRSMKRKRGKVIFGGGWRSWRSIPSSRPISSRDGRRGLT
jgi:hypothetical protein